MEQRFNDKTVVITGSGNGIGRAMAVRYAREGAKVIVNDIKPELVEATLEEIRTVGGAAHGAPGDVSSKTFVDELFATTEATFGYADILINNAAIIGDQRHFLNADEAWWDKFLTVNLKSAFLCTHRAAQIMVRRRKGAVVNVSSGGGSRSHRGHVAYDSSKGGLEAFTRGVALDLAPYGVRVNTLVPGLINTYGLEGEDLREREQVVPLGRYGAAEDLVGAALFLTSEDASYMTGQIIVVDGGVLAQQRSANVDTFPVSGFPKIEADLE
jgi:NAD(P)-dependent dehydrogenase (short-subunit alcohol dehydrogenase family)